MSGNASIFIKTEESYYIGIYVMKNGGIEDIGNTLIEHYNYEKTCNLVYKRYSLKYLKNTIEDSYLQSLTDSYEYYVAALHKDALKNRQCFQYGYDDELKGESVDSTFIPYTHIQSKYIYLLSEDNKWLVSYEGSDYEFEDLATILKKIW